MNKPISLLMLSFVFVLRGITQNHLPLKIWNGTGDHPLLFYMSGDGGMNSFSTNLCLALNTYGYPVAALDSRSYFWQKKTPDQTATVISGYLGEALTHSQSGQMIFVGYSFGADVVPFIVNRLSAALKNKLTCVILLSPSASTDFEIHISDILGGTVKRAMDVLPAINSMIVPKATIIFGSDEAGFAADHITLKNCTIETIDGNHQYDGDAFKVASAIVKYF
ncbi:MAG TPA: AcvB/VirJ family lysyl-phosphatidylglycerol hydrolase [Agriterribacter sp.]|nr:virulence factor family protein [Chitinophagaceae bacterium]HRP32734.1 AcvB/VirJ family lysyl-phosphatidylglycerol hydrolase [Agriterribacter sp.]